jgi:5-methylcytosine-specific restriction endonuclease McrA
MRRLTPKAKESARLRARRWREANRERHRAYTREYRKRHAAERYAKNREWAEAHPELVRTYHKRSRDRHPEKYKAMAERWRAKNPDARHAFCTARRAKKRAVGGTFTRHQWAAMKERYGHRCLCCKKQFERLSMDHIVPIDKGGPHCEENIQPLCIRCNSAKGTKIIDYRT